MIYATVTQRLSDFFPRNLPREEQVYRNYTLPQQFWSYYTDLSLGTIKYNTYVGNIVSTETYDVRVKGGYFNYIDSLDRVYNQDGTYRYNVVIGYNQLTSVNGNSNIYIGRNSSSFSLNTNNTISLGQDIFPENDYIILRPNASRGTIKILPSKSSNQIYFCDYYGNNNILHDTFNETIRNSNFNINQFKNFIENSSFVVKTSYFGLTSSDVVYDDSSLYSKNSSEYLKDSNIRYDDSSLYSKNSSEYLKDSNVKIASTNQNLSSCNITLSGSNIYNRSLNSNVNNSDFRISTSKLNLSSCNITLTGNNIYSKSLSANLNDISFRVATSKLNLSSCNITLTGNNIYSKSLSANLNDISFRGATSNFNISSCNITLTGNNIYSKSLSANLTDNVFRIDTSNFNISSCNITLTGNNIYSKSLSANLTDNVFRIDTSNFNISSCNITLTGNNIYSKSLSANLTDNVFRIDTSNFNISSCNITLTGNNIYSKSLSANLTDNVFRIDTSNFNISSCNINGDTSTITIKDNSMLTIDNSRISTTNQTFSLGYSALSDRNGMYSYAFGGFSENGDSQKSNFEFRGNTTSNSFVELFVNSSNDVMVIPTNKFWSGTINILGIRTNGENCARYMRQVTIGNVGGNVQLYGPSPSNTVTTIGTDVNARKTIGLTTYNTELEVTANNANNSLRIRVRGLPSENMRWMAFAEGIELKF
jgi:uncharacterized protein YxeA